MKEEQLTPWIQNIGKLVSIPGNASCSQNLKIALGFALNNPKAKHVPTLFVISCRNYESPQGIRMNNEAYTAFPCERETLLMEGCIVYILGVEREVLIKNRYESFSEYKGKTLTLIHLFHPSYFKRVKKS